MSSLAQFRSTWLCRGVLAAPFALGGCTAGDASGISAVRPDGGRGGTGGTAHDAAAHCFGVKEIYPTRAGGREWCLPMTADKSDGEWQGGGVAVATAETGVFHVEGSPRIAVSSPAGKAWWRNVELSVYVRLVSVLPNPTIAPEWQLYARGERHITTIVDGASVNGGRPAPPGTAVWPGYPFAGMIDGHCLASSYKGYLNISGSMELKKEISHTEGYTSARDQKTVFSGGVPAGQWIGFKTVIRNMNGDTNVHLETWLDQDATGTWTKINQVDDTGGWMGGAMNPDGCGGPPFNFKDDQLVTWAGPYVNLRFDSLSSDFKWMSAREIEPLP